MPNQIKENECTSFIIAFHNKLEFTRFINNCDHFQIKLNKNVTYNNGPIIVDYGILTSDNHFYSDIYIRKTTPSIAACCHNIINANKLNNSNIFKEIFINHDKKLLDSLMQ